MPDSRVEALAAVVSRVEGAACWLARLATRAALVGAAAGLVLWWFAAGDRITDWWQGSALSTVVLLVCLAPALWLLNTRNSLVELVELPDTLRGVATRRAGGLRAGPQPRVPAGGVLGAVRSVRGVLGDYGDVVGSWGTVAQLVAPSFWMLTLAAFAAVPVVALLAAVAALVDAAT
jgi:hypothetical protein